MSASLPSRSRQARGVVLGLRVEFVVWTPSEWRSDRQLGNPIAVEAVDAGVWPVGSGEELR